MRIKIVFKDFKSNLKNNILYFMANSVGAAELFVFWGLYSVITKVMKSGSTGESGVYDIVVCAGAIVIFSAALMVYSMMKYIRLRIRSYNMLVIMGMRKQQRAYRDICGKLQRDYWYGLWT